MPNALDPQAPGPPERAIGESAGGIGLDVLSQIAHAMWNLPQRFTNESERMRYGVGYDPAPGVEAAMLTMGATPFGVARMGAGEAALGAGPMRGRSSLPMDEAARMARAQELGYTIDAYHGTKSAFNEFDLRKAGASDTGLVGRAVYLSPEADQAGDFATNIHYGRGENPNVMPLKVRLKNPLIVDDGVLPDGRRLSELHPRGITKESSNAINQELKKAGYDGVIFRLGGESTQYAVFDPSNVRSRFAAFDPANEGGGFLLGSGPTESKTAGAAMMAAPQGIRAYHGSPYDFERFDMSKIGTGEGAQAYGHGLYFAENPATAEEYKKAVYRKTPITGEEAQRFMATKTPIRQGRMYETQINADPEHFLDWDKPLSEHPQEIQEKLKSASPSAAGYIESGAAPRHLRAIDTPEGIAALRAAGIPGIKYLDQGSRNVAMMKPEPHEFLNGEKGWRVNGPKGDVMFDTLQEAKDFIKQHDTGATRNYVLFRDDIIDILRKYGLVGMLGGGAAANALFPRQSGSNALQFQ